MPIVIDILIGIVLLLTLALIVGVVSWLILKVPFVPTPRPVMRAMMDLAELKPGDTVIDLGAGDGRLLIEAARAQQDIHAVGYELHPVVWLLGRFRIFFARVPVELRMRSLYSADLSKTDVVFLYLFPESMGRLQSKLETEMHPGTRIVSYMFRFPQREAVASKKVRGYWGESTVYLYRI